MVANFNNPCLSDWGVKQPSTSLNSGVWLLRAACDLTLTADHLFLQPDIHSLGVMSRLVESSLRWGRHRCSGLRSRSCGGLLLWLWAPCECRSGWWEWFSSVSTRNTTAPFQTGSSLHVLLWPCHGSKAVFMWPTGFLMVGSGSFTALSAFHLGSTLCSDRTSFVSGLGLGKKRRRGRWVGISALPSKFIIWPGS